MSMTKLEAVNRCLKAIGEDPVMSLDNGLDDAVTAESVLEDTSREIQTQGWYCNTDEELVFDPDVNGHILLPANTLKVDSVGMSKHIRVRKQGNRLYDTQKRTDVFSRPITLKIVYELDFEDLTFALQNYIAYLAAQRFQAQTVGSVSMDSFTDRDMRLAWTTLLAEEAENEDRNVLKDNLFSQYVTGRYNRLR